MLAKFIIEDLETECGPILREEGHPIDLLQDQKIAEWCQECSLLEQDLFAGIAIYLATGFNNKELGFAYCDAVINSLWATHIHRDLLSVWPFFEVYEAFDSGEYYHHNKRDEDPVEVYTRPAIKAIVESLKPNP